MNITVRHASRIVVFAVAAMLCCTGWALADVQTIIADMDRAIELQSDDRDTLVQSIFERIEADTTGITAALLQRLTGDSLSEDGLVMCVAALGVTKAPEAVDEICRVAKETSSDLVRNNCQHTMARIGTDDAGACLLATIENVSDPMERFAVFDLLGRMQYAGAFPAAFEVLEADPEELYWQPIFVFGKMGDVAVPHLITKVHDENLGIRYNAIHVLGQWLIAPEATQVLQEQFWNEKDPMMRLLILASVEAINADRDSLIAFMKDVASRSDDKDCKQFAKEAIDQTNDVKAVLNEMREAKNPSSAEFTVHYDAIWNSYGSHGDYQALFTTSTAEDEPALKKLRERILLRDSDEAFYDYRKVNEIIQLNRLLAASK